ncbi:MAG: GTPase [Pirellulales bacterium]
MIPDIERTIVALGSAPQPARRAVVRLSGPNVRAILSRVLHTPDALSAKRPTTFRSFVSIDSDLPPLQVSILYWPDSRSYTGQPSAEIHMSGCLPLAEQLIQRLAEQGAEPAARGEFTLRAFLAGKLDLAQAEGVLGVIEADSADELQVALKQLGGNLAPQVRPLRDALVDLLAHLEAGLDFVEEDIEFISAGEIDQQLSRLQLDLQAFEHRLNLRSESLTLPSIVLVGEPNAGKSSLMNAIAGCDAAIVSDEAGTTRDFLSARVFIDGRSVELIDTAGAESIHENTPRGLAQHQLERCIATAAVCSLCIEAQAVLDGRPPSESFADLPFSDSAILVAITKADLLDAAASAELHRLLPDYCELLSRRLQCNDVPRVILTSSITRDGLDVWTQCVANLIEAKSDKPTLVRHTAVRCRSAVSRALEGIERSLELNQLGGGEELIAGELRIVLDELSSIIGEVHSDDILGEIFGRFCIRKVSRGSAWP